MKFDEVKLDFISRKSLYSDETKIIDNNTNEILAYNRRIMPFFIILPLIFHLEIDTIIDGIGSYLVLYLFLEYQIFAYQITTYQGGRRHLNGLRYKLYKKYIEGEK